jgi:tripartite-type tricarboxylate transporter receptor subunit TctC
MQNRGTLRGLGLAMPTRAKQAPEIPTIEEAGIKGLDLPAGSGIFAPPNTPPEILRKIAGVYRGMMTDQSATERLERLGLETSYRSPEDFKADLAAQYSAVRELIQVAGLKAVD